MSYTYPIFKKNTQLGHEGSGTNGTIYMEFISEHHAICHKIDGTRDAYRIGEENSTCEHTDPLWEDWDGLKPLKIYKIRKD